MQKRDWAIKVKERDGYTCQKCGKKGSSRSLHAHHIKPNALGGKNTLENGITLCNPCHRKLHSGNMSPKAIAERTGNKVRTRYIGHILGISTPTVYKWQKNGKLETPVGFEEIERCIDRLEAEGRVTSLTPKQMRRMLQWRRQLSREYD